MKDEEPDAPSPELSPLTAGEFVLRHARRVVVAVVGGTLVLLGIAMLLLPGPALLVIPLGLSVLAIEFAWARRWLRHVRDRVRDAGSSFGGGESRHRSGDDSSP